MEEMHNIGWFILAYVAFLLVGRVVDAVRIVPRRSAAPLCSRLRSAGPSARLRSAVV